MKILSGLDEAVLAALQPRSFAERIQARLGGGWSALGVRERLPEPVVEAAFEGDDAPHVVKERRLVEMVRLSLMAAVAAGKVERRASQYGVELRSKGQRGVVVDVYRLTRN